MLDWRDIPIKTDSDGEWVTARTMKLSKREALELFAHAGIKWPRKRLKIIRKRGNR